MREVAKSMLGFSWAVSLFGLQEMSKLLGSSPTPPVEAMATEFEEVTRAVQSHLAEGSANQFRAADQWTRNLVDAIFDAASGRSFDPRRIVNSLDPREVVDVDPRKWAETGVTMFRQSVDAVNRAVRTS